MAYSTIPKGSLYMNTKLYTGNGSTQSITGVGFQPDMIWQKERSSTSYHILTDAVRGNTKQLFPNDPSNEATSSLYITSFDSDGFGQGQQNDTNESGQTYASWNWKANGAGSANTDGSISSTVSVNTTSGFSVVFYTGTGANATVGHGLGSVPKMIICKNTNTSVNWIVYHNKLDASAPQNKYIELNASTGLQDYPMWNDTAPTSSVFSVGSDIATNKSSSPMISYCFADVQGFSKFSSYIGNGNADGPFVYTGFKPAFVIIKASSRTGDWVMYDNKRSVFNIVTKRLNANLNSAEDTDNFLDFCSNGIKIRNTYGSHNTSGETYIYMAFAENPFVATSGTSAIPVTAR